MKSQTYEEWCETIRAGWAKEAKKHARAKAKLDAAIARGEYRVDGEYKGRNGMIRVVTKVC